MSNRKTVNEPDVIYNQKSNKFIFKDVTSNVSVKNRPVFEILATEGDKNFVNYIEWLGFANDPNMIALSSMHHYYYDVDDLKGIKTVVNVTPLNQIKQIINFFHSISHLLPQKSYFIGCFVDISKQNVFSSKNNITLHQSHGNIDPYENGIVSRIPFLNMMYSLMDSKINKYLSRRDITKLLEDHGFKNLDMTELDAMIYFCAQKVRTVDK